MQSNRIAKVVQVCDYRGLLIRKYFTQIKQSVFAFILAVSYTASLCERVYFHRNAYVRDMHVICCCFQSSPILINTLKQRIQTKFGERVSPHYCLTMVLSVCNWLSVRLNFQ